VSGYRSVAAYTFTVSSRRPPLRIVF
jgi:hypothetical protein